MKFKINRDHFSSALQLVTSVVGARKTMPILQNVLIEAKNSKIKIIATDLDIIYSEEIDSQQVNTEGSNISTNNIIGIKGSKYLM